MVYINGNSIMSDVEFDELKLLKQDGNNMM